VLYFIDSQEAANDRDEPTIRNVEMRLNKLAVVGVCLFCLSLGAQSDSDTQAARHYRVAQAALKDGDLDIAYTELAEAYKLARSNALIQYYMAIVLSKDTEIMNQRPQDVLSWVEGAMKIGLPPKESAAAEELLVSIQYAIRKRESAIRKAEVESKTVTLDKVTGFYEAGVGDLKETEDIQHKHDVGYGGYTATTTRTPLSRELSLSVVDGSVVRGYWLHKEKYTYEKMWDSRRTDPPPHTEIIEYWMQVALSVQSDGTVEGVRVDTCDKYISYGVFSCHTDHLENVPLKGSFSNGELVLRYKEQTARFHRRSAIATRPPSGVGLDFLLQ
jgi:hypothetical protein